VPKPAPPAANTHTHHRVKTGGDRKIRETIAEAQAADLQESVTWRNSRSCKLQNVKCRNANAGACVKLRCYDSVTNCDVGLAPQPSTAPRTAAASCRNRGRGAQPSREKRIATPQGAMPGSILGLPSSDQGGYCRRGSLPAQAGKTRIWSWREPAAAMFQQQGRRPPAGRDTAVEQAGNESNRLERTTLPTRSARPQAIGGNTPCAQDPYHTKTPP